MNDWLKLVIGRGSVEITGEELFVALRTAIDNLESEQPGNCDIAAVGKCIELVASAAESLWDARNEIRVGKGLLPIVDPRDEKPWDSAGH